MLKEKEQTKLKKGILVSLSLILLLTLVLTFGSTPKIASAHSTAATHVTTQAAPEVAAGCGSTSNAFWIYGTPDNFFYYCSGYKFVDYYATEVYAGGWSGWYYTSEYGQTDFCNGADIVYYPYSVHVTEIYLSPTRASWC